MPNQVKQKTQPVLFLDVDGVLNTTRSRDLYGVDHVYPYALNAVREVCRSVNAKVVMSSSWRLLYLNQETNKGKLNPDNLFKWDLPWHENWNTPSFPDLGRGDEVLEWMLAENFNGLYAVLDDVEVTTLKPWTFYLKENLATRTLYTQDKTGFETPFQVKMLHELLV